MQVRLLRDNSRGKCGEVITIDPNLGAKWINVGLAEHVVKTAQRVEMKAESDVEVLGCPPLVGKVRTKYNKQFLPTMSGK